MEKIMPFKKDRIASACAKGMDACVKVKKFDEAREFYKNGIAAAVHGKLNNIVAMLNKL